MASLNLSFTTRLPALDGLRGTAILAVFLYHYAGSLGEHSTSLPLRALGAVLSLGWSGVDLFFVLSGFLITGILYDTQDDQRYYTNFYTRRALRIFPVFYFLAILLLASTSFIKAQWKPEHVLFLLYLGYPAALVIPTLPFFSPVIQVTHVWSLCVEEQFYMAWPWAIGRMRHWRTILLSCLIAAGFALCLRIAVFMLGLDSTWAYTLLFCRMDQLAIGAAIAVSLRSPWQMRLLRWAPVSFVAAASGMIALCGVRHTTEHTDPIIGTIGYTTTAIAYGSLLLLSLRPNSWTERLCSIKILGLFGKYSYGLYLYHFPLLALLSPMKEHFMKLTNSFMIGGILYLLVSLAINLGTAAVSFHFLEAPIMRLKHKFSYAK